jgi:hypothetical protein
VIPTAQERSQQQLAQLGYDPIKALVSTHNYLMQEIERQEKIRNGEIVEISSTGRVKAYRAEVHHALLTQLVAIGEKLLRYGYARVPETQHVQPITPTLNIILNEE